MQLLIESSGKVLCVIWNLVMKTYIKFVTSRSFFKIFKNVRNNLKNLYGFLRINQFI